MDPAPPALHPAASLHSIVVDGAPPSAGTDEGSATPRAGTPDASPGTAAGPDSSVAQTAEGYEAPTMPRIGVPAGKPDKGAGAGATKPTRPEACAVCGRLEEAMVPLRALSPAVLALVGSASKPAQGKATKVPLGAQPPKPNAACASCLRRILSARLHALLEEDARATGQLGDAAMKNLEEWEEKEGGWQKKFETNRTLGQRAADGVAARGGSWAFVLSLLSALIIWCLLNTVILPENLHWDPFPFILLNLFLSMLAAFQAPIIMMSQNRQAARDRIQSDFVSTMSLRAEHNIRHINAKLDHLIHGGWKRLLEVQEVQLWLMDPMIGGMGAGIAPRRPDRRIEASSRQAIESAGADELQGIAPPSLPPSASVLRFASITAFSRPSRKQSHLSRASASASASSVPNLGPDLHVRLSFPCSGSADAHLAHLLRAMHGIPARPFVFTHWHSAGGDFSCTVSDVRVARIRNGHVRLVEYSLHPSDPTASLDDLLQGDGHVALRNDLSVPEQHAPGRIARIEARFRGGGRRPLACANGQVPPRYVASFEMRREGRVAEAWKWPVESLRIAYAPVPGQGAGLGWARVQRGAVPSGWQVALTAETDEEGRVGGEVKVWAKRVGKGGKEVDALAVLKEVAQGRAGKEEEGWRMVFAHDWSAVAPAADEVEQQGGSIRRGIFGAFSSLVRVGRQAAPADNPAAAYRASLLRKVQESYAGAPDEDVQASQASLESSGFDQGGAGSPSEALLVHDDAEGATRTIVAELPPFASASEAEGDWVFWAEGMGRVEIDGWLVGDGSQGGSVN